MRVKKYLLALLMLCLPGVVLALTPVQALTQHLQQQHTYKANFRQTVINENGTVLQQTNGMIAIEQPGRFYWQVDKPTPQQVIADGKNVWIYDKGLQQVTVEPLASGIGNTPALLLTGNAQFLAKGFQVIEINPGQFELKPRDPNSMFSSIKLQFQNNKLTRMQLVDNLGQISTLLFSDVEVNVRLPKNLFTFIPP